MYISIYVKIDILTSKATSDKAKLVKTYKRSMKRLA